jgi:FixJ family two-component response regulator
MAAIQLTSQERLHVDSLMGRLSSDELTVLKLLADGEMNKTIAKTLGVAVRTVESRRARIVNKLEVQTFPELLEIWLAYKGEFQLRGFQAVAVVE